MNVLSDALLYLRQLQAEGVEPAAAVAGISALSDRHPDTAVDLVWLEEPYDRSVHYDALIHLPGDGTVSLSFAREGFLPWPLRGVQRWHDRDLARVNDVVLTIEHAIAQLDFIWDEAPIVRRLVDMCLIQETLQREPIDVDDVDLQQAMDAFRRAHRLFTAEATHRWLGDKGLSPEKLERLLRDHAMLRKLQTRIAAGRVESYFLEHRDDLGEVAVLRLDFPNQDHARAALGAARGGAAFESVARCAIAEALARGEPAPLLESVVLRRRDIGPLPTAERGACPDTLGAIFAATLVEESDPFAVQAGDVIGPVVSERGAALLQVVATRPACLDARTRASIVHLLFEAWLAERRRTARIEWYWGNASKVAEV
jgi:putative peptide maturation system protein